MPSLLERLRSRTRRSLPKGWREDKTRLCPRCDCLADRPKCFYELGGGCPRHDPDQYDPSPWTSGPDPLCVEAADALEAALRVARVYAATVPVLEKSTNPQMVRLIATVMSDTGQKIAHEIEALCNAQG